VDARAVTHSFAEHATTLVVEHDHADGQAAHDALEPRQSSLWTEWSCARASILDRERGLAPSRRVARLRAGPNTLFDA